MNGEQFAMVNGVMQVVRRALGGLYSAATFGLEGCGSDTLVEILVKLHRKIKPDITCKGVAKLLNLRDLWYEDGAEELSELLELEYVLDFFGFQEQEKLKQEISNGKSDKAAQKKYEESKKTWQAMRSIVLP